MRSHLASLSLVVASLVRSGFALADPSATVDITLNQQGQDLAARLGTTVPELQAQIAENVTKVFGLSPIGDFMRSFANATAFSSRGLGVDYASNIERAELGVAVDAAGTVDLGHDVPTAAAAANVTIMAGLNLRRWKHPELTAFANAFYHSQSNEHYGGSVLSGSAYLQYKLFTPTTGWKGLLVQWGGIDFTSGLELAHWGLSLRGELDGSFETGDQPDTRTTITAATMGHLGLGATTLTLPVEVTTNVRLLYVASFYAGLGLDLQVGSASIDGAVSGSLIGTRADNGMVETIGSIAVAGRQSHGPSLAGYHILFGLQFNIWRLKLFVQTTAEPFDKFSVALGTRVVL